MAGIGFFAPLPLALMLPFMSAQSMMMGDAFGKAFQYGKRKISSMTNEEFNAMTPDDLARDINTDYTAVISAMPQALEQSRAFQALVFKELGLIIKSIPLEISKFFALTEPTGGEETESGTTDPTDETLPDAIKAQQNSWTLNFLSGAGVAGAIYNQLKQILDDYWSGKFTFTDILKDIARNLGNQFLEEQGEQPPDDLEEEVQDPTDEQQDTVLTPEFVATLTQGDLQIGGQRTRNFKGKILQWTGTHLILSAGVDKWSIRLWKKAIGASVKSWQKIGSINGGTQQAIAKINEIKQQMGSSYVVSFGERWYLISDGHVGGFK